MEDPNVKYTLELAAWQWDLIVLCMGYTAERADTNGVSLDPINRFARRILRRRIDDTITEIQSVVPGAGEELKS